jgi:hypothetical protein
MRDHPYRIRRRSHSSREVIATNAIPREYRPASAHRPRQLAAPLPFVRIASATTLCLPHRTCHACQPATANTAARTALRLTPTARFVDANALRLAQGTIKRTFAIRRPHSAPLSASPRPIVLFRAGFPRIWHRFPHTNLASAQLRQRPRKKAKNFTSVHLPAQSSQVVPA